MHIDFYNFESWYDLNEEVARRLGLIEQKVSFQIYSSLAQAIVEVTQSLARLFPHRKKVFYLKDCDPFLEMTAQELSRSGLIVEGLTVQQLRTEEVMKAKLDKEALFVLISEDDPLLGLKFDFPGLNELLAALRIYLLRVSHHSFRLEAERPLVKFEARICSLSGPLMGQSGVFLGERVKVVSMISSRENWGSLSVSDLLAAFDPQKSYEDEIKAFESLAPAEGKAVLQSQSRLWDRAILAWNNVDGHAIINSLSSRLGFELQSPGKETRLETASFSRWNGVRSLSWLHTLGIDPNLSRGLIIINPSLIDSQFSKSLETTIAEIIKIQSG